MRVMLRNHLEPRIGLFQNQLWRKRLRRGGQTLNSGALLALWSLGFSCRALNPRNG